MNYTKTNMNPSSTIGHPFLILGLCSKNKITELFPRLSASSLSPILRNNNKVHRNNGINVRINLLQK